MKTAAIHPVPSFSIAASQSGAALLHFSWALLLVLAIILLLAWLVRRTPWVAPRVKGSRLLKVLDTHSIGQRERLVVVEIAGKHLLLGVTATKIARLAVFDKPEEESNPAQPVHFHSQLRCLLKKRDPESEQ